MSASQRRKGKGGGLEVVKLARAHGLEARRTWENATAPDATMRRTDVVIQHQRAQVKRRARAWKDLYLALCGVELVVCRSDNAPWLVVQRFEDWLRFEAQDAKPEGATVTPLAAHASGEMLSSTDAVIRRVSGGDV